MCKGIELSWSASFSGQTFEQILARNIAKIDSLGRYEYCLYGMVSSLREYSSGVCDAPPTGISSAIARLIVRRLKEWHPTGNERFARYDNVVKEMCEAALAEYETSWLKESEEKKR
jgi:hypothetical protein